MQEFKTARFGVISYNADNVITREELCYIYALASFTYSCKYHS